MSKKEISACHAQAFEMVIPTRAVVEGVTSAGEFAGGMIVSVRIESAQKQVCQSREGKQDSMRW